MQLSSDKKARRNYFKSTRERPPNEAFDWTPFRSAEKRFKAKFPRPDLSDILDLALLDNDRIEEVERGGWKGSADVSKIRPLRTIDEDGKGRNIFLLPQIPGLVLLPGYLSHECQRELVSWSLCDHARPPNETSLDTHYVLPREGIWSTHVRYRTHGEALTEQLILPRAVTSENAAKQPEPPGPRQLVSNKPADPSNFDDLSQELKLPAAPSPTVRPTRASELLYKLRWANIGWYYHWGSKQYDFKRDKVGVDGIVSQICKRIVRQINWADVFASHDTKPHQDESDWGPGGPEWESWDATYEPDAGIVNYYQLKDTLMGHVDRSEVCATSPLVSLSLGNAAIFLVGGLSRDVEPVPILLRSGDALVMAGPGCRRAYHGVPRILEGTVPPHLQSSGSEQDGWEHLAEYLQTSRINVNVRQVFPKGFDPMNSAKPR
ncbi:hypothetical protein BD410DRAFT_782516 [Rickenella mellea]|uniref:Fe2OG dioxygenase domain-containing protein n=1 Tax=Rickenella mellea TaxID=50990 RepID=A0A4Y7QK36_9AGAM|nr:hypothetical protein BD410DRAFT_782516 [Rickenella mellea]